MTQSSEAYRRALATAHDHALAWLDSLPTRPVPPRDDAATVAARIPAALPDASADPVDVIDELVALAEPGLTGMPSGRFFGFVIGGTLPAALAADWLVTSWDQNSALRFATPATAALEHAAGAWLLDLLGLPPESDVGFTTGGTMANFVGLLAGRDAVLTRAGWDVATDGLTGAPPVTVLVGEDRHATIDLVLRYLGLGAPTEVAADEQGRIIPDALATALADTAGPTIVCLQAGNLHSGAFDPFPDSIRLAHDHDAWVHVDGAFGLWAAASSTHQHLTAGMADADSWATDAHKTLNVPYDAGVAIVRDHAAGRRALGVHTSYLPSDSSGPGDPSEKVPELSRRARGIPVWAALRSLGRAGVATLVDGFTANARAFADALSTLPGVTILHDVVITQVCATFGSDERTRAVTEALIADGTAWMTGSHWAGHDVLRISVSNWSTDADDVTASVAAIQRAMDTVDAR